MPKEKFYCRHIENGAVSCSFCCLEYENLTLTVISKHKDRRLKESRHVNEIPVKEILQLAVADGNGEKMLRIILAEMGAADLTEVFSL